MTINLSKGSSVESVRTFLAVQLPDTERSKLGAVEHAFGPAGQGLKWVAEELLHITVRFLGGVSSSRLQLVEAAAALAAPAVSPFPLYITRLGAFPNERTPRVIWAGLRDDDGLASLHRLYEEVEDALTKQGFKRADRRFSPHITLARARDTVPSAERRTMGDRLSAI